MRVAFDAAWMYGKKLRIPIRGYEENDVYCGRGSALVTNPYKGL